jgi:site-specific DNA recombinase
MTTRELVAMKAIAYCRISSPAQAAKGDGLNSQEARCREYARSRGYEIDKVFHEQLSGGVTDRPAMNDLLQHLRKHKKEGRVVIIDDISRFARDIVGHWLLRGQIEEAGGKLESPSIEFNNDSDSVLRENLLAIVSQHQRQKNAEQTKNRMRGRLLNGYYPFIPCMGLRHERKAGEGMVLVRDEPVASILQEGLEGFASGRFRSQAELKRFFEAQPDFPKAKKVGVTNEEVHRILTRVLYSGHVEFPSWDISLRKGRHEGLITLETFERIQRRLKEGAKGAARADINEDFPLRGFVACGDCNKPMTACWSTSKTRAKHAYYMCFAKECSQYRKSIRRSVIEGEFAVLLKGLGTRRRVIEMAFKMLPKAWNQRAAQAAAIGRACEREMSKIEGQIATLLDRIMEASSQTVVNAYEKRITALERSKTLLNEKQVMSSKPQGTFRDSFELAMEFLSSPWNLWNSENFEHKRLALRLTFADRLVYRRNDGFRTPKITQPFKVLEGFRDGLKAMAEGKGFELAVRSFDAW